MRSALLLGTLGLAGCLSAPTGIAPDANGGDDVIDAGPDAELAHVWPPAGDVQFAALAAGNLSGDAAEDLIAVNVGDEMTGVFLLVAGVDLDLGTSGLGTTYTEYERIDSLEPPVAAIVIDDHVVIVDNPTGGARITVLEGDGLTEVAQYDTGGPAASTGQRASLRLLGFGPSGGTLGILNAGEFRILDVGALDETSPELLLVPAPPMGWGPAQLVDVLIDTDPSFVVGSDAAAYTSPVPMGGAQNWSVNQRGTTVWSSQVVASIPYEGVDDGQVDLVGFDPNMGANGQICMVDVVGDATAACLATPITEDAGLVLLYDNVAPGIEDDLVVALPGPIGTRVEAYPALRVTGAALVADTTPVPQTFVGGNARLITADLDVANGPRQLIQLADDGDLTCITIRPEGIERCND